MDFFVINWRLVPVKASYFFMLGAVSSLLPFLAVYMRQAGLSQLETAVVYGTMPFIGAFIRPLFGAVADAWKKHKAVLFTCCILTAIFHALLLAVPHHKYRGYDAWGRTETHTSIQLNSDMWVTLNCHPDGSRVRFCPGEVLKDRGCTETTVNETVLEAKMPLNSNQNCSVNCHFEEESDATELCIHNKNDPFKQCQLHWSNTKKKFISLETLTKFKNHMHIYHHDVNFYKKFGSVFFEIKTLTPVSPSYHGNGHGDEYTSVCYNYDLNTIEYNATNIDGPNITCDASAELMCFLDCDELPDLDNWPGFDCLIPNVHHYEVKHFGRIFWMFFLLYFVAQVWFAPIFNLNDGIVYEYLGAERYSWGRQRLWGTIGFITFALVSSLAMDVFSDSGFESGMKNYLPAFALFSVNNILAAVVVLVYKISPEVRVNHLFENVKNVLVNAEVLSLFTVVFVFGIYTGVIETFLYWHLVDMGSPQWLLGVCMLFNCIPEIFILFFAGFILQKLGYVNCLYIVFIAYFVRMFSYAFITHHALVLIVEPLHGVTFGLMYAAASAYASEVTPPGMHGTIQGIMAGLHFGIGKGVGSVSGGWVATWVDLNHMFLFYAMTSLVALVMYFIFNICLKRHRGAGMHALPASDDKERNDSTQNGSPTSEDRDSTRISTLLDDFSVGFDGDKQTLVFKDEPDL